MAGRPNYISLKFSTKSTLNAKKYCKSCIMWYFWLTAIILLSCHPQYSLSQRSIDPEVQRKIDDFIQNTYLPEAEISGLGLTVVQNDGEVLYTTGYGMADIEKNVPVQNTTQFLIASVTKSFTSALAIKHLHQRFPDLGEGVLDTPIRRLLPEVNFTLNDRFRSEHATFRDLLAHRLCLFRDDLPLDADRFNETAEAIFRSRYNTEICGVRGGFEYNNMMFEMAGVLTGVLANKPYEDAMQDLLNEIGMTNTAFVQRTDDFDQMPFRAKPYYVMDNVTHPMNPELVKRSKLSSSSGGLFVPPEDMAKYLRFLLNLGTIDGKEIILREVMEWMVKPSNIVPDYVFKESEDDVVINEFGYGLGLMLSDYDGWQYIQHGGYFSPYVSLLSLYPTQNMGIFTSSNMGPVLVEPTVLHAFIFETVRGNPDAQEKAMKLKRSIEAKKEIKKKNMKNNYNSFYEQLVEKAGVNQAPSIVGQYGSGSAGDIEVSEKFNEERNQTEYYLEYGRWYRGWLEDIYLGVIFKAHFDTDVVQDDYASGNKEGTSRVAFDNGTLIMFRGDGWEGDVDGKFELGLRSELLPPVPWSPDSCGPETV